MTTPKGYPIKGRLDENNDPLNLTRNVFQKEHATMPLKGINRVGLDVVSGGYYGVNLAPIAVEVDSTDIIVHITAHDMKVGDLIRPVVSANPIDELEMFVGEVIDVDHIRLFSPLSAALTIGDTIDVLRYISPKVASDGSTLLTPAPVRIQKGPNGVYTDEIVTKDTANIANTVAMPVEIVGTLGTEINITAGDINVQTSDLTANFDSQRIGDGSGNYMAVNASAEATVNDADAIAELVLIKGHVDPATNGQSTEAKQDDIITGNAALLVELGLKADLTETQPVSAASLPLPTGAATEVTSAAILTELGLKADLTETQPVSMASQPLPTGAATEATSAAILADLNLKADLTETQPVSLATVPLPTGAATEAKQDDAITQLTAIAASVIALDNRAFVLNDNSSTNIPFAAGGVDIIADIGAQACTKIKITCTFGVYMELLVNSVAKGIVPKGGFSDGFLEVAMPANAAIGFRSLSGADITTGEIVVNVMG